MMTSSRLVRGTKGRLFACLGVLTLFAGVIFLYHSTRVELDEVRNSLSKCHQEQDSLAAQVQGKHHSLFLIDTISPSFMLDFTFTL